MVVHFETDRRGGIRKTSEIFPEQASQLAKQEIVDSHKEKSQWDFEQFTQAQRLSNGQLIMIHRWLQHPVSDRSDPI
ncbi:hypothetical protein M0657_001331 [Pyricularia oryzae]|nr:hypothetical protein M9X92_005676 [Pyricularia oryzae]KAI7930969.1 hypothetical protein M0657_001331 [Pyricularia oryzae]